MFIDCCFEAGCNITELFLQYFFIKFIIYKHILILLVLLGISYYGDAIIIGVNVLTHRPKASGAMNALTTDKN